MPKSHETMYQEICEVSDEICNDWEIDWLDSVEPRVLRGILSDNEIRVLERIYDKACKSRF